MLNLLKLSALHISVAKQHSDATEVCIVASAVGRIRIAPRFSLSSPVNNCYNRNNCDRIQLTLVNRNTDKAEYRLMSTRFNSPSLYKCMQVTPVNTNKL